NRTHFHPVLRSCCGICKGFHSTKSLKVSFSHTKGREMKEWERLGENWSPRGKGKWE
ncbi:hypothetical protein AAMO2058_001047500, partial [Amorphochlora amoebiformis]